MVGLEEFLGAAELAGENTHHLWRIVAQSLRVPHCQVHRHVGAVGGRHHGVEHAHAAVVEAEGLGMPLVDVKQRANVAVAARSVGIHVGGHPVGITQMVEPREEEQQCHPAVAAGRNDGGHPCRLSSVHRLHQAADGNGRGAVEHKATEMAVEPELEVVAVAQRGIEATGVELRVVEQARRKHVFAAVGIDKTPPLAQAAMAGERTRWPRGIAQYGAATGVFSEYFIGILTHIYRGF